MSEGEKKYTEKRISAAMLIAMAMIMRLSIYREILLFVYNDIYRIYDQMVGEHFLEFSFMNICF